MSEPGPRSVTRRPESCVPLVASAASGLLSNNHRRVGFPMNPFESELDSSRTLDREGPLGERLEARALQALLQL